MIRILEFFVSLLVVVAVFVLVGVILPDSRRIEESIETNRPARIVFDVLDGFSRFQDWNPLRMHDPRVRYDISGPQFGIGARLDYDSMFKQVGRGSWELVDSKFEGKVKIIRYRLEDDSYGSNKTMNFRIERTGRTTTITQRYSVDYGWNLFGRYAGLYASRNFGNDIKAGLGSLAALYATIPNYDYTDVDIRAVEVPPQNVLYVPTKSERNITAVENAMVTQLKWIKQVLEKNNLEKAGPFRLVTTDFGSETYEFDVVQPVRKKGAAAAAQAQGEEDTGAEDLSDGDSGPPGAEDLPVAGPIDPESIKLDGEVKFGRSYEGKALKSFYHGHPAGLPVVRDQLRAWAATRGLVVHDRAFEEYLQDIETTAAENGEFNVYWPIK